MFTATAFRAKVTIVEVDEPAANAPQSTVHGVHHRRVHWRAFLDHAQDTAVHLSPEFLAWHSDLGLGSCDMIVRHSASHGCQALALLPSSKVAWEPWQLGNSVHQLTGPVPRFACCQCGNEVVAASEILCLCNATILTRVNPLNLQPTGAEVFDVDQGCSTFAAACKYCRFKLGIWYCMPSRAPKHHGRHVGAALTRYIDFDHLRIYRLALLGDRPTTTSDMLEPEAQMSRPLRLAEGDCKAAASNITSQAQNLASAAAAMTADMTPAKSCAPVSPATHREVLSSAGRVDHTNFPDSLLPAEELPPRLLAPCHWGKQKGLGYEKNEIDDAVVRIILQERMNLGAWPTKYMVDRVFRVENPILWTLYLGKRKVIQESCVQDGEPHENLLVQPKFEYDAEAPLQTAANEHFLFSSAAPLDSVLNKGFDLGQEGAGAVFPTMGHGRFADTACCLHTHGGTMILARVALGRWVALDSRRPIRDDILREPGVDALVFQAGPDTVPSGREIFIGDDLQAYPELVIEYHTEYQMCFC